jgi:hypothetical protein
VLEAVHAVDGEALLALSNGLVLEFVRDLLPDLLLRPPARRGFLARGRKPDARALRDAAHCAQAAVESVVADGFVGGMAIAAARGDSLEVSADTPIYPFIAIRWYWENARADIVRELDDDKGATDLLWALAGDDVSNLALLAVTVEQDAGRAADQELAMALAFEVAKQGVVLYRIHTAVVQEKFRKQFLSATARDMGDKPLPRNETEVEDFVAWPRQRGNSDPWTWRR